MNYQTKNKVIIFSLTKVIYNKSKPLDFARTAGLNEPVNREGGLCPPTRSSFGCSFRWWFMCLPMVFLLFLFLYTFRSSGVCSLRLVLFLLSIPWVIFTPLCCISPKPFFV